ncbi:hypothetical protein RAS1_15980 [Phycisphaerae bacterium RAS1]|nr:hypothetical protein RAS1_15980 [Phycisphaerae bacterium RAS1]
MRSRTWMFWSAVVAGLLLLPARSLAPTYQCSTVSLGIDDQGRVSSIVDREVSRERIKTNIATYRKYLCYAKRNNVFHEPTGFSYSGEQLTYSFGSLFSTPTATIRITPHTDHLLIQLESITGDANVDEFRFVTIETANSLDGAVWRFLRYEDGGVGRYLGLMPLDRWTDVQVGPAGAGGYLWATAYRTRAYPTPVSFAGRKAALFAAPLDRAALLARVSSVEVNEGVPIGVAARQHPALQRSCMFWDQMLYSERNAALQLTLDAGVGRVLLHQPLWQDSRQPSEVQPSWGSTANLRSWIDSLKAEGIVVGAHVFPTQCVKNSLAYVAPGAHAGLRRDRSVVLAADLPASQTDGLIQTTESPAGWPLDDGNRDIVIGREIIQYAALKTDAPPYGFVGPFVRAKNQTGSAGALGPQDALAGAAIQHLVPSLAEYAYQWDIASGGAAEHARASAVLMDALGFDYIYCDAVEHSESPHDYTLGVLLNGMYDAVAAKPAWMESSLGTGVWAFPLVAVAGQIDFHWSEPFKGEVDRNVAFMNAPFDPFVEKQLGWAMIASPANTTEHVRPDDFEYLLAKSVAWEAPVVMLARMDRFNVWPHRDANLKLMALYEQLRLSGYFPESVRSAARRARDYMLFREAASGVFHLLPVSLLPVGAGSDSVRAFVSEPLASGKRFVSLWPVELGRTVELYLDGVSAADVSGYDWREYSLGVTSAGPGVVRVTASGRIYLEMANLVNPQATFSAARAVVR